MSARDAGGPPTRQVWRQRHDGRLVVIAGVNDELVCAFDPEHGEELLAPQRDFRARFDYTGLDVRPDLDADDRDRAPSNIEAATLRGLQKRPRGWLRALIREAERLRQPTLTRLARQVLALRGENPGTRDDPDG
jgi:hypothetical protein